MPEQREILNQFLARYRETLAPIRAELADWFRKDIKKRKGSKNSTGFQLTVIANLESPYPQLQFDWYPFGTSRLLLFTPSQPVPEFATREDAIALNALQYNGINMLRHVAFQELVADAWTDADGFTFPKPLYILKWCFDKPDAPRPWIDLVPELIEYYSKPKRIEQPYFAPSEPIPLPRVPADLIPSIREGDPDCLQEWADALEVAGITSYAEWLRWLPTFAERIGEEVRAVAPSSGFSIVPNPDGSAGWWIGDMFSETENSDAQTFGKILSAWNDLHPAIEWLLRQFQLPHVQIETLTQSTLEVLKPKRVNLKGNGHLTQLEEREAIVRLRAEAWE